MGDGSQSQKSVNSQWQLRKKCATSLIQKWKWSGLDWKRGRNQSDTHRSRLLQLSPGWQTQTCFIPTKENWISHSRPETFPEAGLNLQIVQKHFPSNKTSYYRPVLYSVKLAVGGFLLTSSPHALLPSQKDEKSFILAFTKWSPKQLNTGSSLPCLINRILSVDCLPTTSSVSPIN